MWQPKRKYKNTVIEHEGIKFDSNSFVNTFVYICIVGYIWSSYLSTRVSSSLSLLNI